MILIGYIIELNCHREPLIPYKAVEYKQTNLSDPMKRLDIHLNLNYQNATCKFEYLINGFYKKFKQLGDYLWLYPNTRLQNQGVTNVEHTKNYQRRIYLHALIAVKPRSRIMPVPVAALTKAAPSFQQMRINFRAQMSSADSMVEIVNLLMKPKTNSNFVEGLIC